MLKKNGSQLYRIITIRNLIFVFLSFWLFVLNIASANREFTYKIIFSSNSINHWEIKNSVLEVHDKLTNRVNEEYYYEIISQGIQEFKIQEDSTAKLINHQLVITIGDGKGLSVEGSFDKQCSVEIKRKSLILDWFSKASN